MSKIVYIFADINYKIVNTEDQIAKLKKENDLLRDVVGKMRTKIASEFDNMIVLDVNYYSEHDLYYKFISIHNDAEDWGLTHTLKSIIIYLIRYGYSKETKKIICKNLNITVSSLNTNLSYLRTGKIGNKKIKKLLETHNRNMNITLLKKELKDIEKSIKGGHNKLYIKFKNAT